ncbi:DUF4312 family protein [Sporolactobacillus sp. THM7-7]|nr:DUF4312 family protein [Sporolactobacillus sp. THM7-7]
MMHSMDITVKVSGKGNTKQDALNRALYKIQKTVMKQYPNSMILRIEPKDVGIISARETRFTERFLLFFFKRIRSNFEVKLKITVSLSILDINDIPFTIQSYNKVGSLKELAEKIGG